MPSASFATTGWHTWPVPTGVKSIRITLDGAGAGSNPGGRVTGALAVDDRWTLYILNGTQGGLNSGASGGNAVSGGGAAGGDGRVGGLGGDSGGGASSIRINSKTGSLKAVAGGAGGDSGDGGHGGPGGGLTGGQGSKGTTGTNYTAPATGGTQSQGGNGGTSSAGTQFNGKNASDAVLATGGAGGETTASIPSHGGGGGGGGYRAGGGGQAASFGSKVLESTNQLLSPWDTAAVGGTPAKFTSYVSGTRIQATNLAKNPSLEGGSLTGWNSNNAAVTPITLDSTSAMSGVNSVLSTRTASTPSSVSASMYLVPTGASPAFACVVGQPIFCSLDWKADQINRRISGYFQWLDGAGALISSQSVQYQGVPGTPAANTVRRFTITGVPPAGAVTARPIIAVITGDGVNAITGERVWFDNLRVSTGPATLNATNLHPNPSVGDNVQNGSLTYWISNNTGIYPNSLDSAAPISGRFSCLSTRTSSASVPQVSASISLGGLQPTAMLPVTPGVPVTGAVDIKTEYSGRQAQLYFTWWDAAGTTSIGTGPKSAQIPLGAPGVVTRVAWTDTPPAGAVSARLVIETTTINSSAVPVGERTWFDNASVRTDGSSVFFDGSQAPGTGGNYTYAWTSTVGASTSQQYANSDAQMSDPTYFDGTTAATAQLAYNWSGTANASTSNRSYNGNTTSAVIAAPSGIPATDQRPAVQITNTGGNNKTGVRTSSAANIPLALTAGSVITFSAWVRLSPGYPIYTIDAIMRDDPNGDSLAVNWDGRGSTRAITPGAWTRLDWTATVRSSRTITGIYLDTSLTTDVLPVGAYLQTTAWMVNKSPALLDYYDGNTADDSFYDYSWAGTVGASVSYKHHQTTPYSPGGGGGGGSSFTGGLSGATNDQGAAGVGNGSVTITWSTPAPANLPPTPPSGVKINNVDATGGMLTKATTSVKITATVNDPNPDKVRLVVRWSTSPSLTNYKEVSSALVTRNTAVTLTMSGLGQNKHYYVRLYARDQHNLWSTGYNSVDFWTNKAPWAETNSVNGQGTGMTLPATSSATFAWTHHDYDVADYQSAFRIRYRVAASSTVAAGAWTEVLSYTGSNTSKVPGPPSSSVNSWVFNPSTFKGNRFYEWSVKTRDGQGLWGAESLMFSFWVSAVASPPILLTPRDGGALDINNNNTFTWRFIDPDSTKRQVNADLRYRAVGATKAIADGESPIAGQWITILGTSLTATSLTVPEGSFLPEFTYEWEVRTYNSSGGPASDWSDPFFFYAIGTPGADASPFPLSESAKPQGSLGCGSYRVFIYQQGGQKRIGEVDPVTTLTFSRLRDDISNCLVHTNGYSEDCGQLYSTVRSWLHEIVVFRDGVRVWEGPITRITYTQTSVEFEAKDVMAYVYRRVLRQGYNDAYRLVKQGTGGQPDEYLGLLSVVKRAQELIVQGLAPYDPNVLRYLTAIEFDDDARESRVVASWSRTIWEEVDDLAATAGLDYTTVGRRIILWDTHRAIGRLPELRDGDFSDSPIVTEYGMQLSTFFAVTNGSGVAGFTEVAAKTKPYGPIELVASSYSEAEGASEDVQTPEALEKVQAALVEQAKRNISGRWPSPVVVRIPDNSTLSPNANVGFQQLIPGVWMPLRSINTPRPVLQWQKLDSVSVEVDNQGEVVKVVLSPAPNGGQDPDADQAAADAAD